MKKIGLLILFILLSACSVAVTEEPFVPPVIEVPVIEEVITEETPPIEEDLIVEEPSIVIPEGAKVIITKIPFSEPVFEKLFDGDEWFVFERLVFEQVQTASRIVLIYDDQLLKETPPITFGLTRFGVMDVAVRQYQNKNFTLIYPGSLQHAEEFLSLLTVEEITEIGDRIIPYQPIVEELYPHLDKYGKIGVLTELAAPGEFVPFLPRGTHKIFNDPNIFFGEELDTRVIIYPSFGDSLYSPSQFGKQLEPGDIEAFTDHQGVKTILIRERFNERMEWFFLNYEVLGLNGKYNVSEITDLFEYNGSLYRGTKLQFQRQGFTKRDVPFNGSLTNLESVVVPLDVCRIEQTNRRVSPFGNIDTNDNLGFPLLYHVPPIGQVNVAIVAIEFPDVPGEEHYLPIYLSQMDIMREWAEFVSGGAMTFNIQFPDRWIMAPREARYYTRPGGTKMDLTRPDPIASQPTEESVQQLVNASDPYLDWGAVDFVQFIFPIAAAPYALEIQSPGIRNVRSTRAGLIDISVWAGAYEQFRPDNPNPRFRTLWDFIVHEMLHYQGLPGHAPLNGSVYSIMMDQHTETKALLAWESFLMGHFDERHIGCIDPENIDEPIHLQLESLDETGGAPGLKSVMIPVGEFEIVVVEYRTEGPFSTLSPEFHGFTVYYVDVDGNRERCDWCDPALMEQANFKRYLRNATEILKCDQGFMYGQNACDYHSIVQYPGYHLDLFGVRLEFFNDGVLSIQKLY